MTRTVPARRGVPGGEGALEPACVPSRRGIPGREPARAGDHARRELVLGTAEHHGAAVGRRARARPRHGGPGARFVPGVDRLGQARAGHRGDPRRAREVGDEPALVGAGRRGHGGPDRHRVAVRRCGLDRGHGADDREAGLELRPQRAQRVHGAGVAREDQHVRPEGGRRPGGRKRPLGDVSGRARSPWHPVRIHGQHQVRVGTEPVQLGGGREQPEAGVDQRDPHRATLGRGRGRRRAEFADEALRQASSP